MKLKSGRLMDWLAPAGAVVLKINSIPNCSVVTGFPMAGGALDAVAAAEAQEALGIDLAGLGVFSALSRSSSTSAADLLSQALRSVAQDFSVILCPQA